ncbi:septation protein SepH [Gleimia sp. 6138-11-ORH1]|uniref:septation protein SepH n=1 Tax=Gleimia sp. 6138-11-ORH1 TaxID=2973937 RepID=UPI00216A4355|nr:septation protein SepH [Gleimia sp. 6138-11-ORH1]MCS4484435.1 septation protein SepH [Gleimia sp. 6138-11-ORH1]
MIELELLGSHGDGSQLVFTDSAGERYLVTIDDALRAAIRREEIQIEMPVGKAELSPKEIQELLRAGMTPPEIASAFEMEISRINRFVPPILSERTFIVSTALATNVGAELDAPRLEDVVINRLATRGVDPSSLVWSATRKRNHPWQLHLTFVQAARTLSASWEIENSGRLLRALDEQARWLTETLTTASEAVASPGDTPAKTPYTSPGEPENAAEVEKLLDDLVAARGKRNGDLASADKSAPEASRLGILELPEAETTKVPTTEAKSAGVIDFTARLTSVETSTPPLEDATKHSLGGQAKTAQESEAHPKHLPRQSAHEQANKAQLEETAALASDNDVQSLPGLDNFAGEEKPKKTTSKRRSVPTWDEIIFGAKND